MILTLSLIIFLFSCKEEDPLTNEPGTYSSKDSFKVEQAVGASEMAISNISHLIQLAIDQEQVFHNNGIIYPIITKEKENPNQTDIYPMILTLDFGYDTVLCFDNRYRSGKITATISSSWKDSLSTIDANVQNYYMATHTPSYNDTVLSYENITECSSNMKLKIQYLGITNRYNGELYPTQHITTDTAYISTTLGNLVFATSRYTYYAEGFGTLAYDDDKTVNTLYSNGTATDKNNNSWIWNSRNAESSDESLPYFAYNRACYWLISGDIKLYYKNISTQQESTHIINFGQNNQSTCDNNASYSFIGSSITFTLP